ncbi:choice-of-anchor J domain-containing protein [Flavobacterium sp.]|uniref:choice-of-anchor J domain-containing protein n=1 Tax=Flavobacterium sp. TaxID=239 RepID=UPI0035AF5D00
MSCSAPIQVTTLPYSTTDNTANYADNYDTAQPATCAGGTTNYMGGNDVFYSYTPTTNQVISITMTPTAANTSVYIYDGCANLTVACLGGAADNTTGVRTIPNISVLAGHQYIIVVSSTTASQTFGYTLVIQRENCAVPTNLNATGISQTSATLSWTNASSTSWEVVVQNQGDPIPSGSGVQTNNNTGYVPAATLTANTSYDFYVRGDCGDGTFSAWAGPYTFHTLCDAFTVPFQEGFNSTSTTEACWTVLNVNGDTDSWDMNYVTNPFEGNQVAMLYTDFNNGNNNDWLISPQIILNGNQRLKYRYRVQSTNEPNDFRVMLSTNGPSPADFTTTLVPLASYSNTNYVENIVNLSAYSGPVNIAWHVPNGGLDGWRLYIDNVIIEDLPTCPEPSAIANNTVLHDSANITWTNGGTETEWQVLALPCGSTAPTAAATGWVTANSNPFNLTGLTGTTCYDVYVRAVCAGNDLSPWSGPTSFTTQITPPQCGGQFVDNGGASADYTNNANDIINICPPAGQLATVTFVSFNTEANWDPLYVFDGPTVGSPMIASTNGTSNSGFPAGGYWGTTIPGPFTSSSADGCLTFQFRSDGSVARPGWVANVTCSPAPPCTKPSSLVSSNITSDSATVSWTQLPNPDTTVASNWHVIYVPCGSAAPDATTTGYTEVNTTASINLTGLTPNTCYDVYVRAACSGTEFSTWAGPIKITTQCVPFTIPFQEGFNTGSTSEDCWTVLNLNGDTDAWDMDYTFNPYEGDQVAALNTDFNNGNNNDWLISPQVEGLNGNQRLRYRYRVQSTGEPNDFEVKLSTTGIAPADFTTTLVPLASYSNTTYVENVVLLTGVTGTVNVAFHVPNGGLDGWRLYIDKVIIENNPTCIEPTSPTVVNTTATSATLQWTDNNTPPATQWEVLVLPAGSAEPLPSLPVGTGILVNSNPALITGLDSSTNYVYFVRAICSDTDNSNWSVGANFSTKPANDECEDAEFVPVNSSAVCNQIASGVLSGASASTNVPPLAAPCVGTADDDVWYQFIATNSYLNVSLQSVTGSTTNLNMAVYSGTCGNLTQFQCSAANQLTMVLNNLVVGNVYYIRVYSNASTPQTVSFNLCISTPSTCSNSSSICSTVGLNYGNTTGVTSLGQIGCLSTSPNPTFFTIQVIQNGPINYLLTQSTTPGGAPNLDVDYAAWGPFNSQAEVCAAIAGGQAPLTGLTTGCSYSAAPTENFNIANAVAGQFYVILITNFSNQPGYITLTQTNATSPGSGQSLCCPDATFSYNDDEFCKDGTTTNPVVTLGTNSVAGVFSAFPAGLVFVDTATGEIDLANSAPGYYQVTNTVAANGTCAEKTFFYFIRIYEPQSASISYPVTEVCNDDTNTIPVTITGVTGGTFSVTPQGGLNIDPDTGTITPLGSTPAVYVISYEIPDNGPCPNLSGTATIEIKGTPVITSPGNQNVCGTYVLPALSVGNYYTEPAAGGTMLNAGDVISDTSTIYIYANNNGCISEANFIVTVTPGVTPTVDITQPTCAVPTGTIEVTSPLSTGALPTDLFISEVTDAATGSLSYIEIYNGTGTSKNLSNYKIAIYNNGNNFISNNCDMTLSGTLANNDVFVLAVGSATNVGGVVPDMTVAACPGFNTNDTVKLETATGTVIDTWGNTDGIDYTPSNLPGYTYRRNNNSVAPNAVWNSSDWTAIDPEDYTNVGTYSFTSGGANYTYVLDNGMPQTSTIFTLVAPGPHIVTVNDIVNGCSTSINVTIDPAPALTTPVTAFTYSTPICATATTNPIPDTSATGFVTGGTFSSSAGLAINATTGEIDLANSTPSSYTITYSVSQDLANCQDAGSSTFDIVISTAITPVVDFSYTSPVCQFNQTTLSPILGTGFTANGTFSSTTGLDIDASTGVINVQNSTPSTYTVTYTVNADLANCIVGNSGTAEIIINPNASLETGFSYTTPICQSSQSTITPVLNTGFTTGGTFSSDAGLVINASTGEIDVTASTPDIYTVTYTVAQDLSTCQVGGQSTFEIEIKSTITPEVGFSYTSPVCQLSQTSVSPSLNFGFMSGGTFSSSAGLVIDASTGVINVQSSTPSSYTVTYTVNADPANCIAANSSTAQIVINPPTNPEVGFSYTTPVCYNDVDQSPVLNTGFVTGGTFSSTAGLVINSSTGVIDVVNSIAGPYTVTYNLPSNAGICQNAGTQTANIFITGSVQIDAQGGCQGTAYVLTANPVEGSFNPETATYTWIAPNDAILGNTQSITVTETGTYTVDVTYNGCVTSADVIVDTINCVIQKGISVNNDSKNDFFDLVGYDVKKLEIFNRYGMKVYSKSNYSNEWYGQSDNGDKLPDGTYYYVINRENGETKTGWIYLSREQ